MTRFFSFLVYSNIYIALSAFMLFLYYALVLKQDFFLTTPALVFAGTFIGYNFLRIAPGLQKSHLRNQYNVNYEAYPKLMLFLFVSMIICFLIGFWQLNQQQMYSILGVSFIVLIYESLLWKFSIRQLPYIKSFIVALAWAVICVGLQNSYNWTAFGDCFIFILLLTLAFDIKDIDTDEIRGTKTLPMLSKKYFALTLFLLFTLFNIGLWSLTSQFFYFIFPVIFLAIFYLKNEVAFTLAVDGLIILRSLIYILQY